MQKYVNPEFREHVTRYVLFIIDTYLNHIGYIYSIAQSVERKYLKLRVVGSNPPLNYISLLFPLTWECLNRKTLSNAGYLQLLHNKIVLNGEKNSYWHMPVSKEREAFFNTTLVIIEISIFSYFFPTIMIEISKFHSGSPWSREGFFFLHYFQDNF